MDSQVELPPRASGRHAAASALEPQPDPRVAELRGAAMRRLFPQRLAGRASPATSDVALRVHAHLAAAMTIEDLERRLRLLVQYPTELIDEVRLRDGRPVLVRPVLPPDASMHRAFVRSMSPTTRRNRFHAGVADLPDPVLRYLTEVDHLNHLALVGEVEEGAGTRLVAEARWVRRLDCVDVHGCLREAAACAVRSLRPRRRSSGAVAQRSVPGFFQRACLPFHPREEPRNRPLTFQSASLRHQPVAAILRMRVGAEIP